MKLADKIGYMVTTTSQAKKISLVYLEELKLNKVLAFGLPEIDDRYHIWRVPIINSLKQGIGEVIIDAKTSLIIKDKTTSKDILEKRILGRSLKDISKKEVHGKYLLSSLRNTFALGDSENILKEMPAESVDLIFTSPPYYNARPEYSDYISYEEYLLKLRKIIQQCNRVLSDGRFFVMNISPVLIRRTNRNEASQRIAVPFDVHRIFIEEGYEFIDDILWVKPEGAGWATGRGRRFAADRNPLQYKAVPITEYILVYRKKSTKLIDWYIRNHPDKKIIHESKIKDGYEKTNLWKISPTYNKEHPATFPLELARKVIEYYSFKNDVILDPFAGICTTAQAATLLDRRFFMIELNPKYLEVVKNNIFIWTKNKISEIHWINIEPPKYF